MVAKKPVSATQKRKEKAARTATALENKAASGRASLAQSNLKAAKTRKAKRK